LLFISTPKLGAQITFEAGLGWARGRKQRYQTVDEACFMGLAWGNSDFGKMIKSCTSTVLDGYMLKMTETDLGEGVQ